MHVLLFCGFVGVPAGILCPLVTGVGVDFYPWWVAGIGAGLGFNPRVQVYMSSARR
jgi:hypothetical protein